jgi:transposase-like protein
LQKWFLAVSLVLNAKKGISARQLSRDIEVNKNTAWFMLMRIRHALVEQGSLLEGIVEADETYIGGKDKNKHNKDKKGGGGRGRSVETKVPVFGVLERGGKVRAKKVKDVTGKTLQTIINGLVRGGSKVMTDEWRSYNGLSEKFTHEKVSHNSGEYVRGEVHTNSIEGFWSLLKRGIVGQYHKVSAKYLNKYIDEFCFRYNNRDISLAFNLALQKAVSI